MVYIYTILRRIYMTSNKRTNIIRIFLLPVFLIGILCNFLTPAADEEKTHSVTNTSYVTYTGSFSSTVGKFVIDDTYTALCLEHSKNSPPLGTKVNLSYCENKDLLKIMYYGYNGPMEWNGFESDEQAIVATSLLLSETYSNDGYNANCADFKAFIDQAEDVPEYSISFSPSICEGYIDGPVQRTPLITAIGDKRISTTIELPSYMTLTYSDGTTAYGTITINGGDSFYITAPISSTDYWETNSLSLNQQPYIAMIATTESTELQDLIYLVPKVATSISGFSIQWYNKGSIEIIKVSSETIKPGDIIDYDMEGVQYGLYTSYEDAVSKTNPVRIMTTDAKGYAKEDNLTIGTYYLRELVPPTGFLLSEEIITVDVDVLTTTSLRPENQPMTQPFEIVKHGENIDGSTLPLQSAGFMACPINSLSTDEYGNYIWDESKTIVLTSDGKKELFTDENGYAKSIPLKCGMYLVKETTTPKNYLPAKDFIINLEQHSETPTETIFLVNKIFKSYVKIVKTDINTGLSILNNSSTFKIWSYTDESYVSFNVSKDEITSTMDEFFTNEEGYLITPQPLLPGKYRIEEIVHPNKYGSLSNQTSYDIEVSNASPYETYVDENGITVTNAGLFTVNIKNIPITGQIEIYKTGENKILCSSPISCTKPLENVEFTIYAAEDIFSYDGHGNIVYHKGDMVEVITTNKDGFAISSPTLPLGDYIIKESVTPEGYITSDDFKISLTQNRNLIELDAATTNPKLVSRHTLKIHNQQKEEKNDTPETTTETTEKEVKDETNENHPPTPNTGDNFNILPILYVFFLSIIILSITLITISKKNNLI